MLQPTHLYWLGALALMALLSGDIDPGRQQTLLECLMGVVLIPIVIPWGHVVHHYIKAPGDRWSREVT